MARKPTTLQAQDNEGNLISVTPGQIDGQAHWLYSRGQCVALAAAISVHTGAPAFVIVSAEHTVVHAFAGHDDGFIDIAGWHQQLTPPAGAGIIQWRPDMIERMVEFYSPGLPRQNLPLAELFVESALHQCRIQREGLEVAQCI